MKQTTTTTENSTQHGSHTTPPQEYKQQKHVCICFILFNFHFNSFYVLFLLFLLFFFFFVHIKFNIYFITTTLTNCTDIKYTQSCTCIQTPCKRLHTSANTRIRIFCLHFNASHYYYSPHLLALHFYTS